jgi:cell division protein FtsQ
MSVLAWTAAGVLAVGLGIGAVRVVWYTSVLSVQDIRVDGTSQVTAESVRAAANLRPGTPLMRIDLEGVRARVLADRRIGWASVSRVWPRTIAIQVRERTPAAVVSTASGWTVVDREGVGFIDSGARPDGLVAVDMSGAGALTAIAVAASLPPEVAVLVDHVSASSRDSAVLHLRVQPGQAVPATVMWGSVDRASDKGLVLQALLKQPALRYNVSAPDHPAFSGAGS